MSVPRVKMKHVAGSGQYGLNFPASGYVDAGVRLIRTTDLAGGRLGPEGDGIFVPEEAVTAQDRLEPGDLLLSRSGTIGRAFLAPEETARMAFAGFLVRFRPGPGVVGPYLYYCTQSAEFQSAVQRDALSSTIQNFNAEKYNNLGVPLPSIAVQRAITEYLDRETARIDTLIHEQQRLIDLLHERRRAVIDHAIPSEATQTKFSRLFTFHNGDRGTSYPSREEFVPDGIPFVNAGHLRDGYVTYTDMNYLTPEKYQQMAGAKLEAGDVLFCLRGSLGKYARFDGEGGGALASSLVAMRRLDPSKLDLSYFLYFLASSSMAGAIRLAETGTAQPNLSVEQLARLTVPLPAIDDQHAISRQLVEQTGKIDALVGESKGLVELARERRSALITAAVTGQIDVREVA